MDANYKHDYYCIDWQKLPHNADMPLNQYPLAYDRRMSNHNNRGINILMVGGTVEWDSNVEWLKKFSADHPNAKLPMPE